MNGETIQQFFTELRAHNGSDKRIHLILDGAAGYHRAQVLKDKATELNIELHSPLYRPNVNQ